MLKCSICSIVLTSNIANLISTTVPYILAFAACKALIRGLVKPLAMRLAHWNPVTSLSPGYMMANVMRGLQAKQAVLGEPN